MKPNTKTRMQSAKEEMTTDALRDYDDPDDVWAAKVDTHGTMAERLEQVNTQSATAEVQSDMKKEAMEASHGPDDFDDPESAEENPGTRTISKEGTGAMDEGLDVMKPPQRRKGRRTGEGTPHDDGSSQCGARKRHARRRTRRSITLFVRRITLMDRKTSTPGQDVKTGSVEHDPLDQPTETETWLVVSTTLPKKDVQQRGVGLRARALFLGLAGALITALIFAATAPSQPLLRPTPSHPHTLRVNGMETPTIWADVYATIHRWNHDGTIGRRKWLADEIIHCEEPHSPVNWRAMIEDEWEGRESGPLENDEKDGSAGPVLRRTPTSKRLCRVERSPEVYQRLEEEDPWAHIV